MALRRNSANQSHPSLHTFAVQQLSLHPPTLSRHPMRLGMAQQTVSRITARILGSSIRQPGYINRSAITARSICTTSRPSTFRQHIQTPLLLFTLPSPRSFQSSSGRHGILPDSSESTPEADEGHKVTQRTEISIEDYHKLSDHLLEELLRKFEQRQEEKGDLDAEYSV